MSSWRMVLVRRRTKILVSRLFSVYEGATFAQYVGYEQVLHSYSVCKRHALLPVQLTLNIRPTITKEYLQPSSQWLYRLCNE